MKTFLIHWRDGSTTEVTGEDITDACRRAGIGSGAVRAIDYHEEIKSPSSSPDKE